MPRIKRVYRNRSECRPSMDYTIEPMERRLLLSAYTVTDLGTLSGDSFANAINDNGQITGYSITSDGSQHAFLYSNGSMVDLGGNSLGSGNAINNSGMMVGLNGTVSAHHATLFANGTIQDLGTPGGLYSSATGINASGVISGYGSPTGAGTPDGNYGSYRPFVYDAINGLKQIQILPGDDVGLAIDVNDSGKVAGASFKNNHWHGFVYDMQSNTLTQLPNLGGGQSDSAAINNNGQLVGWSTTSDGHRHAVMYDLGTGVMQDLGEVGDGLAWGLNDAGQVVGQSSIGGSHAFVLQNNTLADLNTLIAPGSGWQLDVAKGINSQGQIVGYGTIAGHTHAFLLTRTSTPTSATISGIVFDDHNANGVSDTGDEGLRGWHILMDGTDQTVTNGNGEWSISDVGAGSHLISEVSRSGWISTLVLGKYDLSTGDGQAVSNLNFSNIKSVGSHQGIKLSTALASPAKTISIAGSFDPSLQYQVAFIQSNGIRTVVNPSTISAKSIAVPVPIFVDLNTAQSAAGYTSVVTQQLTSKGLITSRSAALGIRNLPVTGLSVSGSLTNAYLDGMLQVLDKTIADFNKVGLASLAATYVSPLTDGIQKLRSQYASMQAMIAPILSDPTATSEVATYGGQTILLNSTGLGLCDRMLASSILKEKGSSPAPTVSSYSALAASTTAGTFLLTAMADYFGEFLKAQAKQGLADAKSAKEAAAPIIDAANTLGAIAVLNASVGEALLGVAVVPEAALLGANFGAGWYLGTTVGPACQAMALEVVGSLLTSGGRDVATDIQPALEFLKKGSWDFLKGQSLKKTVGAVFGNAGKLSLAIYKECDTIFKQVTPAKKDSVMAWIESKIPEIEDNVTHPFLVSSIPTFTATEGGANPTPRSIKITGLSDETPAFKYTKDYDWIKTTKTDVISYAYVTVAPDIQGMKPGTYTHPIKFVDLATGYSATVNIKLTIKAKPVKSAAGTWSGTWQYGSAYFEDYDYVNLTWKLTQSGTKLAGTYRGVVQEGSFFHNAGDILEGTFSSSSIAANMVNLQSSDGNFTFQGTLDGDTITGTGGTHVAPGTFSVIRAG